MTQNTFCGAAKVLLEPNINAGHAQGSVLQSRSSWVIHILPRVLIKQVVDVCSRISNRLEIGAANTGELIA